MLVQFLSIIMLVPILYLLLIISFYHLIRSLKKENFHLSILMILSPATLLFIVFDNDALFRKEIFFILIFFVHVIIGKKTLEKKFNYNSYLKINLFFL